MQQIILKTLQNVFWGMITNFCLRLKKKKGDGATVKIFIIKFY